MNHESKNPFEPLEPPRGGLAALRARIERDTTRRTRSRRHWAVGMAACVPAILAVAIFAFAFRPAQPIPAGIRWARIAAGIEAPPTEPLTISGDRGHLMVAQRVATKTDDVAFYFVGSIVAVPERSVP